MIFEKIRAMICEQFEIDEEEVNEATEFLKDLGADSLDVVELAMNIEDAFNLPEIEADEIRTIVTVGDLVKYVTEHAD